MDARSREVVNGPDLQSLISLALQLRGPRARNPVRAHSLSDLGSRELPLHQALLKHEVSMGHNQGSPHKLVLMCLSQHLATATQTKEFSGTLCRLRKVHLVLQLGIQMRNDLRH